MPRSIIDVECTARPNIPLSEAAADDLAILPNEGSMSTSGGDALHSGLPPPMEPLPPTLFHNYDRPDDAVSVVSSSTTSSSTSTSSVPLLASRRPKKRSRDAGSTPSSVTAARPPAPLPTCFVGILCSRPVKRKKAL